MSNYGLKISNPGNDVKIDDDKDLFFVSDKPVLKAFKVLNITVTTNGSGNGTTTTAHGLDYQPAFDVFIKGTARNWFDKDNNTYANSFFPIQNLVHNGWYDEFFNIVPYVTTSNIVISISDASVPNQTFTFRVYLYVDNLRSSYSGDGLSQAGKYGMRISKEGVDVKSAKEHQLVYSTDYLALQFHNVHKYANRTITLPAQRSSIQSTPVNAGGYVDFNHGLGYQPYFKAFAFSSLDTNKLYELPHIEGNGGSGSGSGKSWMSFCDVNKIRVSFWRQSTTSSSASSIIVNGDYPVETITIKIIVFTENLAGDIYG